MNIDSLTPGTHSGHVKTFLQGNLQNPIIIEAVIYMVSNQYLNYSIKLLRIHQCIKMF